MRFIVAISIKEIYKSYRYSTVDVMKAGVRYIIFYINSGKYLLIIHFVKVGQVKYILPGV